MLRVFAGFTVKQVSEALSLIDADVQGKKMVRFKPQSLDWGQVEKDPWTRFPITAFTDPSRVKRRFADWSRRYRTKFEMRP